MNWILIQFNRRKTSEAQRFAELQINVSSKEKYLSFLSNLMEIWEIKYNS